MGEKRMQKEKEGWEIGFEKQGGKILGGKIVTEKAMQTYVSIFFLLQILVMILVRFLET